MGVSMLRSVAMQVALDLKEAQNLVPLQALFTGNEIPPGVDNRAVPVDLVHRTAVTKGLHCPYDGVRLNSAPCGHHESCGGKSGCFHKMS